MPAADESSIAEPPPADEELSSFSLEFEIVEDSTKRGRNKLVDNRGFTYNVKRHRGNKTDWQCTVRPKVILLFNLHFYNKNVIITSVTDQSFSSELTKNFITKTSSSLVLLISHLAPK